MPKFSYVVKDQEGKTYKNIIDALNQEAVVEKLQSQNYFIVNIRELASGISPQSKSAVPKKKKFDHKKVKLNDLLTFSRQLATMLESGVTLTRALTVIQSQVKSEEFFNLLTMIKADVEQGGSLSIALAKHPKVFNQFWISLIEVGEASGTIPVVLNKLSYYLEQQASFRSTVVSGLIYPAILFIVSMGAIVVFAVFVGPRFEDIFTSMKVELPMITVILLSTFKIIKSYFFVIIGLCALGITALRKYMQTYQGKSVVEKILFNFPKVGDIYKLIIVERFASQMSILLDAGVPIIYALDITERLVDNNTCAAVVGKIKEGVKEGALLVEPMEKSGFFPPMATQMLTVGEETGELSKMLNHVASFYREAVETFMKRFSTIIEPFMLVFMGAIIGTIVAAMFLPMFNIAQLGGG